MYHFKDGKMYCRHGLILHGVSCATCERDGGTFSPDLRDAMAYAFASARATEHVVVDPPWQWEHRNEGRVRPEHINCRSTIHARYGDGSPYRDGPGTYEIITDPADTRGLNAKVVRDAA